MATPSLVATVQAAALPLAGDDRDYDPLLRSIGDARFVLIGEASHGTHEFYRERAQITKRLIREQGFTAVCIEGDWPDAYRVNRFVRGRLQSDGDARAALGGFQRFPAWMWRNLDVLDFVEWLRHHNEGRAASEQAGFYGIDLYSLHASMAAVLEFLAKVDPAAAARARERYACFEQFGEEAQEYGYAASLGVSESCEQQVLDQLVEMQRRAADLAARDGKVEADAFFHAEQNARLVKNAENYYRTMFRGRVESWNVRDRHMAETLALLAGWLGPRSKLVVWAHNSHLGDARQTEMGDIGEVNLGQLVRQTEPGSSYLIGFTTYSGEVTAATDWGGEAQRRRVRPALTGSIEDVFHRAGIEHFLLLPRDDAKLRKALSDPRLERAIGVIYRPESERMSHYFRARIGEQFDAVIHIDRTRALNPLETTNQWEVGEPPETYPFAV